MTYPTYTLNKISDLLKVPAKRRKACVEAILIGLDMHELAFCNLPVKLEWSWMEWTDDGDGTYSLINPDGTEALSVRVTE